MGEQPPPSVGPFYSEGIVIEARARGSYSCQHSVGYGDKRVPCVLHGDFSGVAVDIFSEVDLDGGAVELHVGVSHPSGKIAVAQGSQSPWLLVIGPILALEVGIGPLIGRGQLIQSIYDEFLEYSEPQSDPDFVAV